MQFSKWVTLGFGALCLMAVAGVLNAQHLYYMSAILLTLPGVSYLLGWFGLRGVTFTRELPSTAWEGEEGALIYAAENHTRLPRYFLQVREALPLWIVPMEAEPPLFNVAAGDTARVVHRIRYMKRGVYRVQSFEVTALDPLGVFAFTSHVACDAELVVYPMPQTLESLALTGTDRYGWQEFTVIALRGSSVDPSGVREYAPGDPLRRIHWRQTARTGKLSVIEFEEPQSVNLVIALDLMRGTEVGEGLATTLEYGVRLAASMAQEATQQGASVQLLTAAEPDREEETALSLMMAAVPGRGVQQFYTILDALARVEANATRPISALIGGEEGSRLLPGTSLLVLTSQLDPQLPAVLSRYAATGANVSVVYIAPETFPGGKQRIPADERQRFLTELSLAQVHPFILRYDPLNALLPEAVTDAELRTAEPVRS